ncbi:CDP-alcohol phosphatidyltransferase family protein [Nanchangia anserum]|uniref:Phosphatidylinositol phosphate synthase n=1 Tax=Nanchangia anserum TaxID=2692125 RepID=A0A8I0GET3_9ACTO|nr:CDP-alcohol phosphatidyltransferase family protein [Nanchangia anserum]MBD3688744.1 CDP-alcohol phosphatidyltransferase family protein [Nanchangia anserum]QOX82486.1 CDP-alcohol phosphatidyltransferase family protein [Nanchangia anserum]
MLGQHGRSVTKAIFEAPARGLARAGVTPNHVTVAGTLVTVVASIVLLGWGHLIIGPIVLGIILFADSLDGTLARLTGTSSRFGAFLDSTLDRIGDGAVFGSLTAYAAMGLEPSAARTCAVLAGIVAIVGAAAVPYARARGESVGVVASVGIAERTDRLVISLVLAFVTGIGLSEWFLAAGLLIVAGASTITVVQRIAYVARHIEEER